jgi:hypothetical protein
MDSLSPDFADGLSTFLDGDQPQRVSRNSKMYSPRLWEKSRKEKRKRNKLSKQARKKNRK